MNNSFLNKLPPEMVYKIIEYLKNIDMIQFSMTNSIIPLYIRELDLASCNITDKGLKYISSNMINLLKLEVSCDLVTNEGLEHIFELSSLKNLRINVNVSDKITNIGFKNIYKLINLEILCVVSSKSHLVTYKIIEFILEISNLLSLTMFGVKLLDEKINHITKFKKLRSIHLYWTSNLSNDILKYISKMTSIIEISIVSANITDEGLKIISDLGIQRLNLGYNTQITDIGLQYVPKLVNLEWLHLYNTNITDISLQYISKLVNLEILHLGNTNITDFGLQQILELIHLRKLFLSGTNITDLGLRNISKLAKLQLLFLAHTCITNDSLPYILKLVNLKDLCLKKTHVTDDGLKLINQKYNKISVIHK